MCFGKPYLAVSSDDYDMFCILSLNPLFEKINFRIFPLRTVEFCTLRTQFLYFYVSYIFLRNKNTRRFLMVS